MRILAIIPSFAGGGAERTFIHIIEYLKKNGHEVVVITLTSKKNDAYTLTPEINRFDLGFEKRKWYKFNIYIDIIHQIRTISTEYKPECILSFLLKANILSILALKGFRLLYLNEAL